MVRNEVGDGRKGQTIGSLTGHSKDFVFCYKCNGVCESE